MSAPRDPLQDSLQTDVSHERRRHPRATIDCPVTIQLEDGPHKARLRDVSRAGVCFFLEQRVPEMTILRMDLSLPVEGDQNLQIEGSGVVVRCQQIGPHVEHFEVAVFLNDMTESNREALEGYVNANSPEY